MGDSAGNAALDAVLNPLSLCLDSESARVADFSIAPEVQARIDFLAERATEGRLSDDERTENEAFVNATDFISILKVKARRHLKTSG